MASNSWFCFQESVVLGHSFRVKGKKGITHDVFLLIYKAGIYYNAMSAQLQFI